VHTVNTYTSLCACVCGWIRYPLCYGDKYRDKEGNTTNLWPSQHLSPSSRRLVALWS